MDLLRIAFYEIGYYAWWWLVFIPIAYLLARYLGWIGIFAGIAVLALVLIFIDVGWIFDEMRQHPENGRDADGFFWMGVLCRIVLFSVLLLPVSVAGLLLRAMRLRARNR